MGTEESLQGRYQLEVIDLLEHPQLARGEQIVPTPTLVRKIPLSVRRIIGDLSNTARVLVGLDILPNKVPDRASDSKERTRRAKSR